MAHFQTLVLVHSSETDPARKADQLMEKYFASEMYGTDAKCDGYVIGGRYDGDIWGKEQNYNLSPDEFQARYGLDVVKDIDNICPVSEIREGFITYAIIKPDGEWMDCENMSHDEWRDGFRSFLEPYMDHVGVAIDCHC